MNDDTDLPGELVDVPEDDMTDIVEQDDGSAIVTLDEGSVEADPDFYSNIADDIDPSELQEIVTDLLDKIEKDKQARKKRDEQYEEGIRRTGLGDDAPGGAQFSGASRVVHPLMAEACVDFTASSIKELFPPNGPVRASVIGKTDKDKLAKADRKTEHMNWQLTEQVDEYRTELEQMLTQLPLGGSQYLKIYWNSDEDRPAAEAVFIDDVFLPFAAGNFYTSPRVTHRQYVDSYTYEEKVASGVWRDVDLASLSEEPEESKSAKATDKIEGKKPSSYNEDGLREIFEVYVKLKLEDDTYAPGNKPVPYIMTIDEQTQEVLSIYRNWELNDDTYTKLDWLIEFQFIPWRGAYGIGLPHLIGGLSAALTGALRALLDSAHISNAATLLKLKGARLGGQTQEVAVTQVQEIEGPAGVDDIKKLAMPMPFNPPSPVLFQLMGWLDGAAKGVVSTSEEKIADAGNNMPVGTAMALIEQGSKVYSAIHARLHRSQERCLRVLHRLNRMYLPEKVRFAGETVVFRKDYDGDMDVVPVSDPNIFSETQRYAQLQALAQRAAAMPGLYDAAKLERRLLHMMKISDADELLTAPPEPKRQNAANENVTMYLGKHVTAFPDQDHLAHISAHVEFLASPALGGEPNLGKAFQVACIEHLKQHVAFFYATGMYKTASAALNGPAEDFMKTHELQADFDRLIAAASSQVIPQVQQVLAQVNPVIQKTIQTLKANMPPPPIDPSQAAIQSQQMQVQQRAQSDQTKAQIAQQKAQIDQAKLQQDNDQAAADMALEEKRLQIEAMNNAAEIQAENARTTAEIEARAAMNAQDNRTAMTIVGAKLAHDQGSNLSTGTGINPDAAVNIGIGSE